MFSFVQSIMKMIEWYHLLIIAIVILLGLLLQLIYQLVKHQYLQKIIWPSHSEAISKHDLDERESVNHIRQISQQHLSSRRRYTTTVRRIHWAVYFRLQLIRRKLGKVPAEFISMIPSSLWLFENFHLLYRELKKFQASGGSNRFKTLPIINQGKVKGYPRIYALAREIIACNRHLTGSSLRRLLVEYQKERELTTAELWALQNTLSLCLLEDIILESKRILAIIETKKNAEMQLKKMLPQIENKPALITDILLDALSTEQTDDHVFLAHIVHRLRSISVDDVEIAEWLNSLHKQENSSSSDWLIEIVNFEGQFEASAERDISTLVTSLKSVSDLNWEEMFVKISPLDLVLSDDPADVYNRMDLKSKGHYRLVVGKLAAKHHLEETQVAEIVVAMAQNELNNNDDERKSHIGYFLTGQGYYALLEKLTGSSGASVRRQFLDKLIRIGRGALYFTFAVLLSVVSLALVYKIVLEDSVHGLAFEIIFLLLLLIPVSEVAVFLSNYLFTRLVKPKPLMALELSQAIPEEFATFVVIPVILSKPEQFKSYAKRLENHYLANNQDNLFFAILADYKDADKEMTEEDVDILAAGIDAINSLNKTYTSSKPRFSLFIRQRQWNESQNCWMGWERKRGKLEVFNALLCGEKHAGIELAAGSLEHMPNIRYVITLDEDTEILRDGAAELIGVMAHPLNRPVFDIKSKKIIEGYAIVQSEIRTRISNRSASLFARLFSGQTGIDPYASVVSDVYQDLFSEGIYAGKGIYDLYAFHQFLGGAISDNSVLSHDLLEGSLLRCAFASGIKLMDSCPASVVAFVRREHRWIRGDWQLLPWIFSSSRINGLSRWKMIDNLRRSLAKPALLLLIIGNAIIFPEQFWLWLIYAGFEPVFNITTLFLGLIWQKIKTPTARFAKIAIVEQLTSIVSKTIFSLVLLPYRSLTALDAIFRTLYRLLITHKNLLEWQTAETVEKSLLNKPMNYWRSMWMSWITGLVLLGIVIFRFSPASFIVWAVLATLWLISPWLSWLVSIKRRYTKTLGSDKQTESLRLTARRTWRYFEDFSTIDNHWLCPDNVQIYPGPKNSNKTSPTNIGLQLLSVMSARDLGYISLFSLLEDCENVIETIKSLPKWNGHLYNWYNIRTLQVLHPRYISTVDSGNFAVHLIALKQGLLQQKDQAAVQESDIGGLAATLQLAGFPAEKIRTSAEIDSIEDWISYLEMAISDIEAINNTAAESSPENSVDESDESSIWLAKAETTCRLFLKDVHRLQLTGQLNKQQSLSELAENNVSEAANLLKRIDELVSDIDCILEDISFSKLFDNDYQLFSIGYNESSQSMDSGHYDLLASEARVTSYYAIARGEVHQKHWFILGRPLTLVKGIPTCVSWSGSMFEYLMPNLVMKTPSGSVLQQSCLAAVLYQIKYARRHKLPWGISESQYYRFDTNSNYQYRAAGVQKLRLQASLKPAKVIAPYATMLALGVLPKQAADNLDRLRALGAEGEYGFYEALDYNHPDSNNLQGFSLVKCFMAHHQGMSLVSINNYLNKKIMQRRFHSEPVIRAGEVLLEEKRTSTVVTLASRGYTINVDVTNLKEEVIETRICNKTNLVQPLAHILSNNHYMIMLTSDGAGFSRCDDVQINRWQPETIHEQNGSYIYLRNIGTNQIWSASYLPVQTQPDDFRAVFNHDKAEFIRRDGHIQTYTSITVSPLSNFEVRRVALTNYGKEPAVIELTSYQEVVADNYLADTLHPAFSKLFVETEYVADRYMLIANRRKRGPEDKSRFVMHALLPESKLASPVDFEIDRRSFIGRGGSLSSPAVINGGALMSNRDGFSKDTILSLRASVTLPAGGKASMSFVTGFCTSRAEAMKLRYELNKTYSSLDVFKLALTSSHLKLKYLNITSRQLNAIQNLVSYLYYPNLASRSSETNISRLKLSQSGLWRYGISGDHPIILLQVSELKELPVIKDVLLGYEYLRVNQVKADLVILNEEPTSYTQELDQRIRELTGNLKIFSYDEHKPSLFLLQKDHLLDEEYDLLLVVSHLVLDGKSGLYGKDLIQNPQPRRDVFEQKGTVIHLPAGQDQQISDKERYKVSNGSDLEFYNGIGGFAQDGAEYEIRLDNGQKTPMPWINVIANKSFGFLVSETGAGYTWADNSRENKLTTWSNDPIIDPVAEAIYIRDEASGGITSPASLIPGYPGQYKIRHGFGYSVFENIELGLKQEMTMFVPADDRIKLWLLSITNLEKTSRQISLTLSVEWVLGVVKSQTAPYIKTEWNDQSQLLTARNLYNDEYRDHPAYIFSSEPVTSYSGDRKKFFGIGGSIRYPSELTQKHLSREVGAGLDPCGVIQNHIDIQPGESKKVLFGLGQESNIDLAKQTANKYREVTRAEEALEQTVKNWQQKLRTVTIKTPDRAMDILANGWLQYQVISCRLLARSAFYQCGGAIGFRDQLQDVLALLDIDAGIVRQQILTCCSRQFIEGDVQHWWHPQDGLGVRTRITDDLLWLPYVTAAYIEHTGDKDILQQEIPFITGDELRDDQAEMMIRPQISEKTGSVYEHCLLAIDRASNFGFHGLPLMGGGDWNDGMNRVGIKGEGESVWLGWFLYSVLQRFIPIVREYDAMTVSQQLIDTADELQRNLERYAWDGEWYLRAFFDNGVPLGSKTSDECRIDSISQSWSVLSGGAGNIRALTALDSARRHLVHEEHGISLLLTPPFDKTKNDPGYIKGYFPGIRENGGQYTHSAIWLAMAYAQAGKGNDAYQLLSMLNPIHSTSNISSASKYEKEPYVMSADISMGGAYTGKAGWSWYTGSAGWMYQAVMRSFLGINKKGDSISIDPSVPDSFKRYVIEYRHGKSLYEITVLHDHKIDQSSITLDGQLVEGDSLLLIDDGNVHNVEFMVAKN